VTVADQESVKFPPPSADDGHVNSPSIRVLLDHLVRGVDGVVGAILATADGFVVADRLPGDDSIDAAGLAAMTAATLGLGDRLTGMVTPGPSHLVVVRSADAQVLIHRVAGVGGLAVLAVAEADLGRVGTVTAEIVSGLERLAASAPDGRTTPPA
jgi:predicted regulator of Ras-like GTPase activity (Roadblock/LC7/MglB family)